MYQVNLLPKRFRLPASSEVYSQQNMKTAKLKYLHFTKEIRVVKRDVFKK